MSNRHETFEVAYPLAVGLRGRTASAGCHGHRHPAPHQERRRAEEIDARTPSRAGILHDPGWDMHGNVWEWCWDGFAIDDYQQSPTDDPRGPRQISLRVIRGGSCGYDLRNARSAARACRLPEHHLDDVGVRVVRDPSGPGLRVKCSSSAHLPALGKNATSCGLIARGAKETSQGWPAFPRLAKKNGEVTSF
jgi:Sulfatase-modifying factor enzyme 1